MKHLLSRIAAALFGGLSDLLQGEEQKRGAWFGSPYEAANHSPRRSRTPGAGPTEIRRELTPGVREELVRGSRYLVKSNGFARQLVSDNEIYSVGDGFAVQPDSPDEPRAKAALAYWEQWAKRCEVTNRFSLEEVESLICRAIDTDGEIFVYKTRRNGRPRIQLIGTHRVRDDGRTDDTTDGLRLNAFGEPVSARVALDADGDIFEDIPFSRLLHIFEPEDISLIRNPPTIQHGITDAKDEMELLALEKHALKANSDISNILKVKSREAEASDDDDFGVPTSDGEEAPGGSDPRLLQSILGGKLVKLEEGEDLTPFESQRPSPTFTGFLRHLRRRSAEGVLPYEFVSDASEIGGAVVRLVVAKSERKFSRRQSVIIRRFLEAVWWYVIGCGIADGDLESFSDWWKISVVTPRKLSVDAGREAAQHRANVETGLTTISDHFESEGAQFPKELRRRAKDAKMILDIAREFDVPVEMLWKPSGMQVQPIGVDQAGEDEPPPRKR